MAFISFQQPTPRPTGPATRPNTGVPDEYPIGIFANDLEHQWKGNPFAGASFRLRKRQGHAVHYYSEKDGGEVEPVGQDVSELECRIPFLNGALPAAQETWTPGQQYPQNWRKMNALFDDRTPGILQHPALGSLLCVMTEFDTDWTSATSDGTWATAKWIITLPSAAAQSAIQSISPLSNAIGASQVLDTLIAGMTPPLPNIPEFQPNFAATMQSIQGLFDTATNLSAKVSGTINQLNYRVNAIAAAIDRTKASYVGLTQSGESGTVFGGNLNFGQSSGVQASNSVALQQNFLPTQPLSIPSPSQPNYTRIFPGAVTPNVQRIQSVMNAPARMAIDRMRVACAQMKLALATTGKPIGLFISGSPATLHSLTMEIQQVSGGALPSLTDLMNLNGPAIVSAPVLPRGTKVRYYLPATPPSPYTAPDQQAA